MVVDTVWHWIKWTILWVLVFVVVSIVTGGTPYRWLGDQADIIKAHTVDRVFPSMKKAVR